ncbi:MAG TPA: DUF1559 domain-containing protein [Pirellulales bacterium]|nr:DUF1559 domain-containing protein [Pirellulales bacterium]
MPIRFICPHCGHQTDVAEEYAGQSGPCVECGQTVTMPLPGQIGYGSESPAALPRAKWSSRLTGGMLAMVGIGCCLCCGGGLLLALFFPAIQAKREQARRDQCTANLRRIAQAMQSYYTDYRCYPPGYVTDAKSRPIHSWRALLLPYLDPPLAAQYRFDEPWDGPNNSRLANRVPDVYRCSADTLPATSGTTNYVVINGQDTIFDGDKCAKKPQITDGMATTLLVVEIVDSDIGWLEPRDLRLEQLTGAVNAPKGDEVSSEHAGGAHVLTADGKTHFVTEGRAGQEIQGLSTKSGGETVSPP